MSNTIKDTLTAIADAIRTKTGKTEKMKATDMPAEIASIQAGTTGGKDKEIVEGTITDYKNDEVEKVRDYAFYNYNIITSVDLPEATSVSNYAFAYCYNLTSVNLPAVKSISIKAFYGCSALVSVDLPALKSISNYAFSDCSSLASVKIGSKNPNVCRLYDTNAFSSTTIASGTGSIYVPDALVEDYKTATNWALYSNQIKPLSEAPTT